MLFIRNRILNHLNFDKRSNLHLVSLKIDLTFTILTNISQKNSLFLHSVLLMYLTYNTACMEKEMAAHSSVLAWRISGTAKPGGCHLWGHTESDTTEAT